MTNKTFQIAKFYTKLFELKDFLNGELIPLAVHTAEATNDRKLFESFEVLATDIEEHLKNYELKINKQGESTI